MCNGRKLHPTRLTVRQRFTSHQESPERIRLSIKKPLIFSIVSGRSSRVWILVKPICIAEVQMRGVGVNGFISVCQRVTRKIPSHLSTWEIPRTISSVSGPGPSEKHIQRHRKPLLYSMQEILLTGDTMIWSGMSGIALEILFIV